MATTKKKPLRIREIATIKTLVKKLGIDDDSYRAMLVEHTGCSSLGDARVSSRDRQRVIEHLRQLEKRMGMATERPSPPASVAPRTSRGSEMGYEEDEEPRIRKIRTMWLHLYDLGEVEAPTEAALEAWVARQVKIQRLRWLQPKQMNAVIEQLKRWTDRVQR